MVRRKIPPKIVRKVIFWYLDGLSLKEIADKVGISKTSVYNIIELKNTLRFKLSLYHEIAVNLAKKRLNIHDFAEIIRAGKLLQLHGIDKDNAWHAIAKIPIACFQIGIEPRNLILFLHRFEQFVVNSKAMNQKEAFRYAKSFLSSYRYLEKQKVGLKEEIAGLEATLKRLREAGQFTTIRNDDLRKAYEHQRIKYIKLKNELKLRSITSPETAFTNKDSLDRLNSKFGLTLTSDAVFRKVCIY